MGLRFVTTVALLAAGLVACGSSHDIHKRQVQYPQRGRPVQRIRAGFQVEPASEDAVPEYVEQPSLPQPSPRQARVSAGSRITQKPSFTVTDEVDPQPPDYDQETPAPRDPVTTSGGPPKPNGPQRRRPQTPVKQPEVLRGPSLTQQDLSPVSHATPRRQVKPPVATRVVAPVSTYEDDEQEEPAPPVPPPARTVLIAQGPVPTPPQFNFGGAVLVTEEKPEAPPSTARPQRGRAAQRRTAAARSTSPPTTEATPPPPPSPTTPARRAGARRQGVRLQNAQANPTLPPPPPPSPTSPRPASRLTTKRPVAAVAYNPDSNLAPPPDEEVSNSGNEEPKPVTRFTRRPTEATTTEKQTPPPPPRTTSTRRPGGKRLKIGTLPSRPSTTTTTTEAPVEEYDDYDDQPAPPPRRSSGDRTSANAPKPAVVFEEPSESQAEVSKQPARGRVAGRPTNKSFRPRPPVDDYEDGDTKPRPSTRSESSRPASSRNKYRVRDEDDYDYDQGGEYTEVLYRNRNNAARFRSRGNHGRGPSTSPKPTRRTPPKDLPKRKDGRIIDYLGDPNFPRELMGYDLTDYPFYTVLPDDVSNFDCEERANGFYASVPHQCQVFHYCFGGNRFSFLCANYTLYDQTTFTCQFANKVNCITSERYYNRNDDLYKVEKEEDKKDKKEKKDESAKPVEEVEEEGDYVEEEEEEKEVKAPPSRGGATSLAKNKS